MKRLAVAIAGLLCLGLLCDMLFVFKLRARFRTSGMYIEEIEEEILNKVLLNRQYFKPVYEDEDVRILEWIAE